MHARTSAIFPRGPIWSRGICLRASYLLTLAVGVLHGCVWIDTWANRAPIAKRDTSAIERDRADRVRQYRVYSPRNDESVRERKRGIDLETSVHARKGEEKKPRNYIFAEWLIQPRENAASNGWKRITLLCDIVRIPRYPRPSSSVVSVVSCMRSDITMHIARDFASIVPDLRSRYSNSVKEYTRREICTEGRKTSVEALFPEKDKSPKINSQRERERKRVLWSVIDSRRPGDLFVACAWKMSCHGCRRGAKAARMPLLARWI